MSTGGLFKDRGRLTQPASVSEEAALQRVCVRMLFDPTFVAAVYADPMEALAGLPISEPRVLQLVNNDRRLWGADALRPLRALKVLMEEFRVSSALLLDRLRRRRVLDAFFSSHWFHEGVQSRGYMALAFADYLDHLLQGMVDGAETPRMVLRLESEMAWVRRAAREGRRNPRSRVGGEPNRVGSGFAVTFDKRAVTVPTGVVEVVQHVEKWLFEASLVPALALCDDPRTLEPCPILGPGEDTWLLEVGDGGKVDMSRLDTPWREVVLLCEARVTTAEMQERLRGSVGDPQRVLELAQSLADAGVLERW